MGCIVHLMKRLISLISTKGKSEKEAVKEVWEAYQKYQKVYAEAEKKVRKGLLGGK